MNVISGDQIKKNDYPKLVRDRIPEMLKAKGLDPKTKIMEDGEYFKYLLKKLVEESTETLESLEKNNLKEELADVLEVIEEIIYFNGIKKEEIITIQSDKRIKNGGFKKKILMLEKP